MTWINRLFGRGAASDVDDAPMVYAEPVAGQRAREESDLPTFRPSQGRILSHGGATEASQVRALLREAFTPSQPVTQRSMFAGRREVLRGLITAIQDQRLHYILYGDRGIGKTSILRIMAGLAEDAGYLVCYISCGEGMTFERLARRIAERVPLLVHSGFDPSSPEVERGLHLSDILSDEPLTVSRFGEELGKISGTQIVVLLDEFDRVQDDAFRSSIAELIKNLSDSAAPAQLVITGVASDVSDLVAHIPSIRRNVLGVMVPNMVVSEVNEMLDLAERKAGLTFSAEARELINLASLGLPYLVGLVAQHASFVATDRGETTVAQSDVRNGIRTALADITGRVSGATLHAIDLATQRDQDRAISKLAHAALRNGGLLSDQAVPTAMRGGDESEESAFRLLEQITDDPLKRWRFRDDGAAILIWLNALVAP